jgi:hypothetical protein
MEKSIIDSLPHGAINQIQKETGISRPTIYAILNNTDNYSGNLDNFKAVTKAANDILEERALAAKTAKDSFNKALQGEKYN